MIEAKCMFYGKEYKYNLFGQYNWPTEFLVLPSKGDWIESICGRKRLTVVGILHRQGMFTNRPFIDIYLED